MKGHVLDQAELIATYQKKACIAVDPSRDDRAWLLIDGRWVLE